MKRGLFTPPPTAHWYVVPAGTRASQCSGENCKATIYWIENPKTGRRMPVDVDVEGGEVPSDTNDETQGDMFTADRSAFVFDGRGVSHFLTCPDADRFSRGAR